MQYQIKKPVMSTGYKTRQRGFEPPTPWSVAKCSIQLSYAHMLINNISYITTGLSKCQIKSCKYFNFFILPVVEKISVGEK